MGVAGLPLEACAPPGPQSDRELVHITITILGSQSSLPAGIDTPQDGAPLKHVIDGCEDAMPFYQVETCSGERLTKYRCSKGDEEMSSVVGPTCLADTSYLSGNLVWCDESKNSNGLPFFVMLVGATQSPLQRGLDRETSY